MHSLQKTSQVPIIILRILVLLLIATTWYAVTQLRETARIYDAVSASASKEPTVVTNVSLGDKKLAVPSYGLFRSGNLWALVSRDAPLKAEAGYELEEIPVPHGDAARSMKVARIISADLQRLVNSAEADGEPLMVSSAYRSLDDQKLVYESFVKKNGEEMASIYVLPVGASEHHTGLSVDFSSHSSQCSDDSDTCSLGQSAASWLAQNASRFGFIQRYPQGKQPITGVGFEPWHYRYVGIPFASALDGSDLTFDEAIQQIAPGFAKT